MDKLQNLAKNIFNECAKEGEPVTMTEALEMAEMELKSAKVAKNGSLEIKKVRKPRVYNASDEKTTIFNDVLGYLTEKYNVSVLTNNKKLQILYNNKSFTLDLIENRPKKSKIETDDADF